MTATPPCASWLIKTAGATSETHGEHQETVGMQMLRLKHFIHQLQSDKDTCGWASKSHLGKSSVAGINPPLHMT